jgi:hypothetical protein
MLSAVPVIQNVCKEANKISLLAATWWIQSQEVRLVRGTKCYCIWWITSGLINTLKYVSFQFLFLVLYIWSSALIILWLPLLTINFQPFIHWNIPFLLFFKYVFWTFLVVCNCETNYMTHTPHKAGSYRTLCWEMCHLVTIYLILTNSFISYKHVSVVVTLYISFQEVPSSNLT